jgi:basic membrane protein A
LRGQRWSKPLALALGLALVVTACGDDDDDPETSSTTEAPSGSGSASGPEETTTTAGGGGEGDFVACEVTDEGGVDDRSFNQTAFEGLEAAAEEIGFEPVVLESASAADYEPNVAALIEEDCDLIVTVGFALADATGAAAEANPDQNFAIVDNDFFDVDAGEDITYENVRELTFQTDEAAFLAGYVAAAMSETGIVGTYGGRPFPTVTIFMDGFYYGVQQYNEDTGEAVEVIGWDPAAPDEGSFTDDFENVETGRLLTVDLLEAGADVIMPVAGPVGQGTIEAIEAGGGEEKIVWVDTDGCVTLPDACSLFLTSVQKKMDVAVQETTVAAANGEFEPGLYVGTLENDGVDIAPFHDFEDAVPAEVKERIEELREEIISGELTIGE